MYAPPRTLIIVVALVLSAKARSQAVAGEITFLTTNNVYVSIGSGKGASIGDTLHVVRGDQSTPCLVVTNISSTSAVCTRVPGCTVQKKDQVELRHPRTVAERDPRRTIRTRADTTTSKMLIGERLRGRISAATYSTMPEDRENDHRVMYRLSGNADRIGGSNFSAETHLNYRRLYPSEEARYPQRTEFFNVYSLAVTYAKDSSYQISLGRKINNNASSLGAIDGLQAQKELGRFFMGGVLGFRPDIVDFGLNTDLLQYGGYAGHSVQRSGLGSRTTLGLLQQTNGGAVDRRYTYFQNSTTINDDLNLFGSFELDLFSSVHGSSTRPRLTNLYVSARYRISKRFDLFASYDARRRVVYYETFRSSIEQMLEDDDAMQGIRFRAGYRPFRGLGLTAGYSRRFESDGENGSENINGLMTISRLFDADGRWTVQVNRNTSSYVRGDVLSVRYARPLLKKKVNISAYFRTARYRYTSLRDQEGDLLVSKQRFYGADVSFELLPKLTMTALGELSDFNEERSYRLNLCITKRFDRKR